MDKTSLHIQLLPDQPSISTYEQKPIQNYGLSLLKGMGFTQQRGIGKKPQTKNTQILQLKSRPKGLGLGAQQDQPSQKLTFEIGQPIQINIQPHNGLFGLINSIFEQQQTLQIELYPSYSKIKIKMSGVKKITKEQMKILKKQFHSKNKESSEKKKDKKLKWIIPQIRVKVINKNLQCYLKKMLVTEIISKKEFQCRDNDGKTYNYLTEDDVQTVVPKIGGIVIILCKEHFGEKGSIIEIKKQKSKVKVQTIQDLQILKLSKDDISQYVQI